MSVFIKLNDVSLQFPIYGAGSVSLKKTVAAAATGGRLGRETGVSIVNALNKINFSLKEGDRLGVIGHNGAGKSTLLRLLAGAYYPTSGIYERQGDVASLIDPNMGIEHDATGLENIYLRAIVMGMNKNKIKQIVEDVISFSGLGDYIYMPVRTYSTGMLMRLSFSISTSLQADILLMDEWLSVGDAEFQEKAENRMRAMLERTGILVLASHSTDLLKKECNRILHLEHGQIISIS